jgi:CRP/FNR family cyclic AMP-dependent transcriptional regulator
MLMDDRRPSATLPGVDEATMTTLLRFTRTIQIERGHKVFVEGETGAAAYLVISGKLKITRKTASGAEGVLAVLGPGQMLGELSLLDGRPRSATAQALTSATLEELTYGQLSQLLHDRPEIALWMLHQLAHRLRLANDVAADLVFSGVPIRVAQVLIKLAEEFGVAAPGGVEVYHGLTQTELAQLAGASRESVNRALSNFAARNWVSIAIRTIRIHDLAALQAWVG